MLQDQGVEQRMEVDMRRFVVDLTRCGISRPDSMRRLQSSEKMDRLQSAGTKQN